MGDTKRLLKCFAVVPEVLGDLEFSNPAADTGTVKIGMAATGNAIVLKATTKVTGRSEFPTGEGYRFKVPAYTVPRVREWQLAQFDVGNVDDETGTQVTDVRARLHDGTDELYFTAGSWTVVSDPDVDWNSLEEVKDNLGSWDLDSPLGLVFELSTTDKRYTPAVSGFKLLYEVELVDEFNDWLYGALVDEMKSNVRPIKDIMIVSKGGTTIDFAFSVEDKLEVWKRGDDGGTSMFTDIVAVYDETTDPNHRVNLFDSFDTVTREIDLTGPVTTAGDVLIRAVYEPLVAVTTSQDYVELAASPSVEFSDVDVEDLGEAPTDAYIMDVFSDPPTAVILPAPRRAHVAVTLTVTAPTAVDLHRLATEVTTFLQERRTTASPSTGDEVTLRIVNTFGSATTPNLSDLHTATMSFRLENVYFHHRDAIDTGSGAPGSEFAYGVKQVEVAAQIGPATVPITIGG